MQPSRADSTLVKAVARAYRWQRLLEGTYASMRDLAAAEIISPTYVSRLLRLALLAPDVVEAITDGDSLGTVLKTSCLGNAGRLAAASPWLGWHL
jgi:hypothetical protein